MKEHNRFDYHDLVTVPSNEFNILEKVKVPFSRENSKRPKPSLRKMAFFIFREGIIRSFYKLRSSSIYNRSSQNQYFILGYWSETGKYYAGSQHSIHQPYYYFLPDLQFEKRPLLSSLVQWYNFNPFLGYINDKPNVKDSSAHFVPFIHHKEKPNNNAKKSLYIIGAGRYVLTEILPVFRNYNMKGLCDFNYELLKSRIFSEFEIRTNDFEKVIQYAENDKSGKLFIISSYHSYHTEQALRALELKDSKVVIEKPPCITMDDFHSLLAVYDESRIYIAYHRRFADWNIKLKEILKESAVPVMINMIIHEIEIPDHHWYFAPNQGTRISGNLCHWIDLAYFWISQVPQRLMITRNTVLGIDSSVFNILYRDGSLVNFIATDKGDGTRGVQEQIAIKGKGIDISIDDYVKMKIWHEGKMRHNSSLRRDKGHIKLNKYYTSYVQKGIPSPYMRKDFVLTTYTYIKFVEMWEKGEDVFTFEDNFYPKYQIQ